MKELVVTDIKMTLKESKGMKAICNIVVNGMLAINGIRVVQNATGKTIVAMPSSKKADGTFRDTVNPVNQKARSIIEAAVLEEYRKKTTIDTKAILKYIS